MLEISNVTKEYPAPRGPLLPGIVGVRSLADGGVRGESIISDVVKEYTAARGRRRVPADLHA